MKSFSVSTLLFFAAFALTAPLAHADVVIQDTSFNTGYIPDGFDTNDNVQIVGEGIFSNGCYRPAGTTFNVDVAKKEIQLRPRTYFYDGICIQVIIPYSQVIDVGLLPSGAYKVVDSKGKDLGELKVKVATKSSPDDFLYAPISQAYVTTANRVTTVTISGEFSNSCMALKEVVTDVQSKVIVIQPIAELAERSDCTEGSFPFEKNITIQNVPVGRYLLHVRSLNAKAINNLVEIK